MSYAVRVKQEDGSFTVDTPGRGFSLIRGLDEQTAYNVEQKINRAYANGREDVQREFKLALGIEGNHS